MDGYLICAALFRFANWAMSWASSSVGTGTVKTSESSPLLGRSTGRSTGYAGCSGTTGSGALFVARFLFFGVSAGWVATGGMADGMAEEVGIAPALTCCCWTAPYWAPGVALGFTPSVG